MSKGECIGKCCEVFFIKNSPGEMWKMFEEADTSKIKDIHIIAPMLRPLPLSTKDARGHSVANDPVPDGTHPYTCVHYVGGECSIYDHRPYMCRDFPGFSKCPWKGCNYTHARGEDMSAKKKSMKKMKAKKKSTRTSPRLAESKAKRIKKVTKKISKSNWEKLSTLSSKILALCQVTGNAIGSSEVMARALERYGFVNINSVILWAQDEGLLVKSVELVEGERKPGEDSQKVLDDLPSGHPSEPHPSSGIPNTGDPNNERLPGLSAPAHKNSTIGTRKQRIKLDTPRLNRQPMHSSHGEGVSENERKFLEEAIDPMLKVVLSKDYQAYRNGFLAARKAARPQGVPKELVTQHEEQTDAIVEFMDRAYVLGHEGDRIHINKANETRRRETLARERDIREEARREAFEEMGQDMAGGTVVEARAIGIDAIMAEPKKSKAKKKSKKKVKSKKKRGKKK